MKITISTKAKSDWAIKIEGLEPDYHFVQDEINIMKDEKDKKQKKENDLKNKIALEEEREKREEAERKTKQIEEAYEKLQIKVQYNLKFVSKV